MMKRHWPDGLMMTVGSRSRIGRGRRLFVAAGVMLALSAAACVPAAQQADRRADAAACDPVFGSTDPTTADAQYYRLSIQLRNCLSYDLPLSVDVGAPWSGGTPLSNAPSGSGAGGDSHGATLIWDVGDTRGVRSTPFGVIPKGTGSGSGDTVGFTTVPFWNGYNPGQTGPCANSIVADDGSGVFQPSAQCEVDPYSMKPNASLVSRSDFQGNWAIYTPSATLLAYVDTPALYANGIGQQFMTGFPYVSANAQTSKPLEQSGAVATGIMLERKSPTGDPQPFYYSKKASAPSASKPYGVSNPPQSQSPPAGDFQPTSGCLDNLVAQNGQNNSNTQPANWASKIVDGPHQWYLTTVYGEGYAQSSPLLFFLKGWASTGQGQYQTLALGGGAAKSLSRKPHIFQAYLRDLAQVNCGGTGMTAYAQLVGGTVVGLNISNATLTSPFLVNSTVHYADLRLTTAKSGENADPTFGYSVFAHGDDGTGTDTASKFHGADLSDYDLIGSTFTDADLGSAVIKNTRLAYADLSNVTDDGWSMSHPIRCRTLLPSDLADHTDDECAELPQAATWTKPPHAKCVPTECVYISVYNNTTRFLTRGVTSCKDGDALGDYAAPSVIAPLDTAQLSFAPSGAASNDTAVLCSITYANGPWGKIRITVDNNNGDGPMKASVDSGFCQAGQTSSCLPKAAPATLTPPDPTAVPAAGANGLWPPARPTGDPVKMTSNLTQQPAASFFDVTLCEPEAVDGSGNCARTPALPQWVGLPSGSPMSSLSGGPTLPLKPSPLTAEAVREAGAATADSGYGLRVTHPVPAGISAALSKRASLQYGYEITDPAGGSVAHVYAASGLPQAALDKELQALCKAGASPLRDGRPGGKPVAWWWRAVDGGVVAVAYRKGALVSIRAERPEQLQALSGLFAVGLKQKGGKSG